LEKLWGFRPQIEVNQYSPLAIAFDFNFFIICGWLKVYVELEMSA